MNPLHHHKLSDHVRQLCNKVALERSRPEVWKAAARLRQEASARLVAGQTLDQVAAWLEKERTIALGKQ